MIVVFSGGMDSTVALYSAMAMSSIEAAVFFHYGSRHNDREFRQAQEITSMLSVRLIRVDLPFIGELFSSSLLKGQGEIPEGHYEHESMKSTVVPFRNGIMLSIAVGIAESLGAKEVWYGAHAGDHAIYPDCRGPFIVAFARAAHEGTYNNVRLVAPFEGCTKREIAYLGKELGVPFSLTYSCYNGGEHHCGLCGTCTERKEALAGFDSTRYDTDINSQETTC
jgi:7-cyano-7-deazaguanine synthase